MNICVITFIPPQTFLGPFQIFLSKKTLYMILICFFQALKDELPTIISDSYEFCINDYITSGDENEYITEIFFYVQW